MWNLPFISVPAPVSPYCLSPLIVYLLGLPSLSEVLVTPAAALAWVTGALPPVAASPLSFLELFLLLACRWKASACDVLPSFIISIL